MRSIGKMEGELIFGYNWLFVMEYSILAAMRVFMRYETSILVYVVGASPVLVCWKIGKDLSPFFGEHWSVSSSGKRGG